MKRPYDTIQLEKVAMHREASHHDLATMNVSPNDVYTDTAVNLPSYTHKDCSLLAAALRIYFLGPNTIRYEHIRLDI